MVKFAANLSEQDIRKHLGVPPGQTLQDILDAALSPEDLAFLRSIGPLLATSDKSTDQKLATTFPALPESATLASLQVLEGSFLTGDSAKSPYTAKIGSLPTKDFRNGPFQEHEERFNDIMRRVEQARPQPSRRRHRGQVGHAAGSALLGADGPGAPRIAGAGLHAVVRTLAVAATDRVDRRQVDHVEASPA